MGMNVDEILKALDICLNSGICPECPRDNDWKPLLICRGLAIDIQELLKKQEAKTPAIMQDAEGIWSTCSICGHKLRAILAMKMDTYFPKFCSECGQAVKWK